MNDVILHIEELIIAKIVTEYEYNDIRLILDSELFLNHTNLNIGYTISFDIVKYISIDFFTYDIVNIIHKTKINVLAKRREHKLKQFGF